MTSRIFKSSMFKTLSSSLPESKSSDPWPCWSYMLSFSSIHTGLHALILLPKPHTLGTWVHIWLVILSHAVMSVMQVFRPLWCWVCLVSLWEMVSHLSRCELIVWGSMLWFEQQLEWWRWFIQSWHVALESAKDQILRVDTPGQHMPPRVQYRMTCLLIR
jgi:hypothetical protein